MTSPAPRVLLVTHGRLGEALKAAAAGIAGTDAGVSALSNEGLAPEEVERRIAAWRAEAPGEGFALVLVDLVGGSPSASAERVARADPGLAVVTGVSLAMLLEYLHHRDRVGPEELVARLESRGRSAVRVVAPAPATEPAPPSQIAHADRPLPHR